MVYMAEKIFVESWGDFLVNRQKGVETMTLVEQSF